METGSSGRIRKAFTQCSLPWMLPGLFSPSVWPCASGPQCSHPYCRNKNSLLTRHGFWEGRIEWWMGTGLWELCKEHPFLKNQGRWLSGAHFLFALDLTCLIFFYYNHQSVAVQLVNCRESLTHSRASFFALYDLFSPCEHLVIWFRTVPASYHILLH